MGSIDTMDFFLNYLKAASGGKCVLCEKKFESDALVFHHVDERTKVDTISNLRKKGILYVLRELPKCVPLCISCHNRFTHTDDDYKIDHISRIKEYHSWANRPGHLFCYHLNFIIASAIVHKEVTESKVKWEYQEKQELSKRYLEKLEDVRVADNLMFPEYGFWSLDKVKE